MYEYWLDPEYWLDMSEEDDDQTETEETPDYDF